MSLWNRNYRQYVIVRRKRWNLLVTFAWQLLFGIVWLRDEHPGVRVRRADRAYVDEHTVTVAFGLCSVSVLWQR